MFISNNLEEYYLLFNKLFCFYATIKCTVVRNIDHLAIHEQTVATAFLSSSPTLMLRLSEEKSYEQSSSKIILNLRW